MADTQPAPAGVTPGARDVPVPGPLASSDENDLADATQGFLNLMDPPEETPEEEEAAPTEAEESTDDDRDESAEEEAPEELEATAEEETEEEAETEEETEEEPELFAVKVDGEEVEVTFEELVNGYSRTSSFTKKSQQLAEQRKAFETEASEVTQQRDAIQAERQQMHSALEQMLQASVGQMDQFQNINWDQLRSDDPMEWAVKRQELLEQEQKIATAQAQQKQLQDNFERDQKAAFEAELKRENEALLEKMPEWSDPKKQHDIAQQLAVYAESQGWAKEEINQLVDHRSFLILQKAMLYDQLKSADVKSKKVKGKPKVARPGRGVNKEDITKKQRADSINRLKRGGGLKEAADAFEAFL